MSAETRIKRVSKTELGAVLDSLGESVKSYEAAKDVSDNKDYTVVYSYTLPTMTVEQPGASVDLFGKTVSDLQESFSIANGVITATLKYVSSYDGFSSGAKGHFFAIKGTTSADKVKLQFKRGGAWQQKVFNIYTEGSAAEDGVFIYQIVNKDAEKAKFTFIDETNGEETVKEYDLNFTYESES